MAEFIAFEAAANTMGLALITEIKINKWESQHQRNEFVNYALKD